MNMETYFYNCSNQYIDSIHLSLYGRFRRPFPSYPNAPPKPRINQTYSGFSPQRNGHMHMPFNGGMPNWLRLFLVCIITAQCWPKDL
jgi:hypothetical protein